MMNLRMCLMLGLLDNPREQMNLADNPEHAQVLEIHRKRCQELATKLAQ